ncbi:MAG TPA: M23 family metallopeptidase [Luteibaculaceae bacterium]|nr:M23 family metallopeptidase [Luteibaculaceae bacterium]
MAEVNEELTRKKRLIKRLKSKYRLQIIRDNTFEERFSLRLTPMNVIVVGTALFLVLGAFYVSLILFTPLKEYIPGYADGSVKRSILRASMKADSLQQQLDALVLYERNLKMILQGKLPMDTVDGGKKLAVDPGAIDFSKSEQDSLLRERVKQEEEYSLSAATADRKVSAENYFFAPLRGVVSAKFKPGIGHYGVDVVAPAGEPIKAIAEGTVVSSAWTSDAGYVIQVQHSNNLISIYKHNSSILKNPGDKVALGEPIAIIGNTGEMSTGPHLHLELWRNGRAIDPEKLIVFQ